MAIRYVSAATGDNGDDGTTEELAWATIDKAMNEIAGMGTGPHTIYVKADGTYAELATIDTAGDYDEVITFEGYTSTPGDGGQATMSGESTRSYCIDWNIALLISTTKLFYVFKNFIFKLATTANVRVTWDVIFKNCQFTLGGTGVVCGAGITCEHCVFDDNTGTGFDASSGDIALIGCRFIDNSMDGAEISGNPCILYCVFAGNGSDAIECLGGNANPLIVVNCTIDGDDKVTNNGIDCGTSFWGRIVIVNNIIYDCYNYGITSLDQGTYFVSRNNLLYNNTDHYNNFQTFEGEVLSAPQFVDEVGGDYALDDASPARDAGYDGYALNGSDQLRDIGAIESTSSASGGRLLGPNKIGNMQAK